MTILVALLSTGKGTWGHVARLITEIEWEQVIILTNDFGEEKFSHEKPIEKIKLDLRQPIPDLREDIIKELKPKLKGEVAINFVSGDGKEHMALMSALIKLGIGFRFMALTKEGPKEV